MSTKLHGYIMFNGNAAEAVSFYQGIFGGSADINLFKDFASTEMPVEEADMEKVMHAQLTGDNGIELMLSDTPTGMNVPDESRISFSLSGEDEAVLRGYWDALRAEGNITAPLETPPWGGLFGMLTDKYGVNWMVSIDV